MTELYTALSTGIAGMGIGFIMGLLYRSFSRSVRLYFRLDPLPEEDTSNPVP
jgi:hypothetical protein